MLPNCQHETTLGQEMLIAGGATPATIAQKHSHTLQIRMGDIATRPQADRGGLVLLAEQLRDFARMFASLHLDSTAPPCISATRRKREWPSPLHHHFRKAHSQPCHAAVHVFAARIARLSCMSAVLWNIPTATERPRPETPDSAALFGTAGLSAPSSVTE